MKMLLQKTFVLILVLLATGCVRQNLTDPRQMSFAPLTFEVPEVQRQTLPNGIHLYLREDHELPLVSITAMIGAGTIADPAVRTGQGDLLAKLLTTGGAGERGPKELEETLARMAADLSSSAETYHTTVSLSMRSTDLARGVEILADLLRRPGFDPVRLEVARRQAVEGIRRRDDRPGSLAQRALKQKLYPEHPLGRVPTVETVQAVTREDLVQEHGRFFLPNNLWLGISGDFDPDELKGHLAESLGDWRSREFTPQQVPPLEPATQPAVWIGDKDLPQTTILLGDIGISKDNPDLHAVRVMNFLLGGGGFNSRLMREIRSNRGLAYSAYSYFQVGRRLPGPFVAGSETRSDATTEVVFLMREIMQQMREDEVTDEQLKVARESLINSFVFGFTDNQEIVNTAMRLDFYDYPPDYLATYRDKVAAVGSQDVLRAAREYLRPERQSVILVGDRSAFADLAQKLGLPAKEIPEPAE